MPSRESWNPVEADILPLPEYKEYKEEDNQGVNAVLYKSCIILTIFSSQMSGCDQGHNWNSVHESQNNRQYSFIHDKKHS